MSKYNPPLRISGVQMRNFQQSTDRSELNKYPFKYVLRNQMEDFVLFKELDEIEPFVRWSLHEDSAKISVLRSTYCDFEFVLFAFVPCTEYEFLERCKEYDYLTHSPDRYPDFLKARCGKNITAWHLPYGTVYPREVFYTYLNGRMGLPVHKNPDIVWFDKQGKMQPENVLICTV